MFEKQLIETLKKTINELTDENRDLKRRLKERDKFIETRISEIQKRMERIEKK